MDKPTMNFEIPPGLMDLLQDFTVAVLRDKPLDLVKFAAEYFNHDLGDGKTTQRTDKKGTSLSACRSQDSQLQVEIEDNDESSDKITKTSWKDT